MQVSIDTAAVTAAWQALGQSSSAVPDGRGRVIRADRQLLADAEAVCVEAVQGAGAVLMDFFVGLYRWSSRKKASRRR